MSEENIRSSKVNYVKFHGELKTQFLKLYKVPLMDEEFIDMAKLLESAGVKRSELDSYFLSHGGFDFKHYSKFIDLAEKTIIKIHTEIQKLP